MSILLQRMCRISIRHVLAVTGKNSKISPYKHFYQKICRWYCFYILLLTCVNSIYTMTPTTLPHWTLRPVTAQDLEDCIIAMEGASYPSDEAASPESLRYRQAMAGEYFYCACIASDNDNNNDGKDETPKMMIIGFVCATRCASFTHASMSTHDPHGPLLAIHSVVVHESYRRQGWATRMLREYVKRIEQQAQQQSTTTRSTTTRTKLSQMVLLAKSPLLGFYVSCGFTVTRPSPIVHGQDVWYECIRELRPPCWVVDAFGRRAGGGTGNPAAVVWLSTAPSSSSSQQQEAWMQQVAAEFNLSETAFVWPLGVSSQQPQPTPHHHTATTMMFGIAYYTPTVQVALCGHATLAAASVLFSTGRVGHDVDDDSKNTSSSSTIYFQTAMDSSVVLQADIVASKKDDGDNDATATTSSSTTTMIRLTFPAHKDLYEIQDSTQRHAVLAMLQRAFGTNGNDDDNDAHRGLTEADIVYMGVARGVGDLLIQLHASQQSWIQSLHSIQYQALCEWDGYTRGVILTCLNNDDDDDVDFGSRFFAPKAGINEDPVTGSAHTVLVPFYHKILQKETFQARQWSPRGGWLSCRLVRTHKAATGDTVAKVEIAGRAVTTLSGHVC